MRRHPTAQALLPAAMLLAGCGSPTVVLIDAGPGWSDAISPVDLGPDIDILFVIVNSGTMLEEQQSLAASLPRFIDVLEAIEGGLPNVNIGVISTDVGAGPFPITACTGNGDNGALLSTRGEAAPVGCTGPSGAFIQDWDDGAGGRIRNYDTTQGLAATFSCIAQLGITGCGFEQPLESMRRALDGSVAGNAGFLRTDAHLAVIFIADEDDCSAWDTGMFDTASTTVSDPLGPLSSYRCFEYGVDCAIGNDDRRTPGPRMDCGPRVDSPYMFHTDEYVTFLGGLKDDPGQIIVAGIIGDPTPVAVGADPETGNPQLAPSCVSAAGEASPGVRLGHFVDAFAPHSVVNTICNEDLSDALILSGLTIIRAMGHPCVERDIDLDGTTAGVQYQSEAADVQFAGEANQQVTPLAECNAGRTNIPCWYLYADSTVCGGLMLGVERDGAQPPPDTRVRLRCLVP